MGKRRKRLTMPKYAKKYASVIAHINKLKGNVTEVAEEAIEEVVEVVEEVKEVKKKTIPLMKLQHLQRQIVAL